jgi:uncharacterized membrane protein
VIFHDYLSRSLAICRGPSFFRSDGHNACQILLLLQFLKRQSEQLSLLRVTYERRISLSLSLSLIVAFCTGIAASWDSWVAKRIDPWVGVAWRTVYGFIATMVLSVAGVEWWNLSGLAWFWLAMAGVLLAGGWLCYMHALQRDNSELSVALSATYTLPAVFILVILGQQVG